MFESEKMHLFLIIKKKVISHIFSTKIIISNRVQCAMSQQIKRKIRNAIGTLLDVTMIDENCEQSFENLKKFFLVCIQCPPDMN